MARHPYGVAQEISSLSIQSALTEDFPSFPNRPGPIQKYSFAFGVHVQTSYQAYSAETFSVRG